MAQDRDGEPRRKKKTNPVALAFLGLLVVSLGGFSITSFGGGRQAIGKVGDREISVNQYIRALRQELQALSAQVGQTVSLAQAAALGVDARVRGQLVAQAALDAEADRLGLSVGDARVAQEVVALGAFTGLGGAFDPAVYRATLAQNGMTVAEFEAQMRDDLARSLLQGAVAAGFAAPGQLTRTLHAWAAERRGFTLLRLAEADLPAPVPAPTEADLTAYYEANIAEFTRPEARQVTYAALLPADIAADQPVDEAVLRDLYQSRIDEFVVPERRLVERLVYPDEAAAAAAKARLDAGESFETLVADRGLTLADIDLGDLRKADLGAAGDAVFALTEPGVAGPLPSDLGPALFRMNGILAAEETSFEEARATLAGELQTDAARRAIADRLEALDDRLASGDTLEDLAQAEGLALRQIVLTPDLEDPLIGYADFRAAAQAAAAGDFPEFIVLEDGGVVALRLDAILPAAPIPFAEARAAVEASWRAATLARALADRAVAIKAEVEGGANLSSYGILSVTPAIPRDGFVEGVPDTLVPAAFAMAPGDLRVIEGPGFTGLLRLDSVTPADPASTDGQAFISALAVQAEQALAQDAFQLFSNAMTNRVPIFLDDSVISAVHAQFP